MSCRKWAPGQTFGIVGISMFVVVHNIDRDWLRVGSRPLEPNGPTADGGLICRLTSSLVAYYGHNRGANP